MANILPVPPGQPKPPDADGQSVQQYTRIDRYFYSHMSETQAKAMTDVAKNTYAVPARQETYRFLAVVALIVLVLFYLLPVFVAAKPDAKTVGLVIVASLAIIGAKPAIDAIAKAVKGS